MSITGVVLTQIEVFGRRYEIPTCSIMIVQEKGCRQCFKGIELHHRISLYLGMKDDMVLCSGSACYEELFVSI